MWRYRLRCGGKILQNTMLTFLLITNGLMKPILKGLMLIIYW